MLDKCTSVHYIDAQKRYYNEQAKETKEMNITKINLVSFAKCSNEAKEFLKCGAHCRRDRGFEESED